MMREEPWRKGPCVEFCSGLWYAEPRPPMDVQPKL